MSIATTFALKILQETPQIAAVIEKEKFFLERVDQKAKPPFARISTVTDFEDAEEYLDGTPGLYNAELQISFFAGDATLAGKLAEDAKKVLDNAPQGAGEIEYCKAGAITASNEDTDWLIHKTFRVEITFQT